MQDFPQNFQKLSEKKGKVGWINLDFLGGAVLCNDPLEGGHILAHFKVEVIKQPPDNNFDKTSA